MKATEMLKQQHRDVKKLFARVSKTDDAGERRELLDELEQQLRTHMHIEETIFYPAVREGVQTKKMQEMVPEAYEEHHVVQLVLDELPDLDAEDERFTAKMTVLEELIEHHVEEEEKEMFPAAEKLGAEEMKTLAAQMQAAVDEGNGNGVDNVTAEDEDDEEEPAAHRSSRGAPRHARH